MERLTMRRRRLNWLLGTLGVLLSVFLVFHLLVLWIEDNTLEARFNKINPGMTIEQVESLLGPHSLPPSSGTDGTSIMTWCFPGQCALDVWFDASGKAINKQVSEGSLRSKGSLKDFFNEFLRKIGV
jgi:hypothetical protein